MRLLLWIGISLLLTQAITVAQSPAWTLTPAGAGAVASGGSSAQASPVIDPMGDATGILGMPGVLHDIDTMSVTITPTSADIEITFHGTISAPSTFGLDAVLGRVELDLDQDPTTGLPPLQGLFTPPLASIALGVDALVLLDSESANPGSVIVLDATMTPISFVPILFTSNSFMISIPLADLGDDGQLHFGVTIGTVQQPTDALEVVGATAPAGPVFLRGDCFNDGAVNITDAVTVLLASAGQTSVPPCGAACDVDGDGTLNVADGVFLLNYLFLDGPTPPAPFPGCGAAASPLPCNTFGGCSN